MTEIPHSHQTHDKADTKPTQPIAPRADADPGLRYGEKVITDENGIRRIVNTELGKKAHQLPRLTY